MSSPRTWGCFFHLLAKPFWTSVFPTHVGVFLPCWLRASRPCGLPHARGGVSRNTATTKDSRQSSPRTWGCFHHQNPLPCSLIVFPTHVGVFPSGTGSSCSPQSLPH